MKSEELDIGDNAKQYIFTVIGECVGCIELEIAQNVNGDKVKIVTNSHGDVGFIPDGSRQELKDEEVFVHKDNACTLPEDKKRGPHICGSCWFKDESEH